MSDKKPPLRIVSLEVENFKRVQAVEIKPDGSVVEITGRNGQGKSSIMDAIWAAIGGLAAAPPKPIRKGAEQAVIRCDLGTLMVTRTFKTREDGSTASTLAVTNSEGLKATDPQRILNELMSVVGVDPVAFLRMDAKAQVGVIQGLVTGVDFAQMAADHKTDFDARRDKKRDLASLQAQAAAFGDMSDIPDEPVDLDAILDALGKAGEENGRIEARKTARAQGGFDIERMEADAQGLRDQIALLTGQLEAKESEAANLKAQLTAAPPLPDPVDVSAVREEADAARLANAKVSRKKDMLEITRRATDLAAEVEGLDKAIADRRAAKAKAIADADLPVEGLGFNEDGVTLGDLPLEQASSADQLRLSVAIAAAMNPRLRVVRVKDGSLLDAESFALLAEIAQERDLQVWVETVASGRPAAVRIEDGRVVEPDA